MPSQRSNPRNAFISRFMRSQVARWALAAVLMPVLVLGAFGGTTFLIHAHDEHDAHLHASFSIADSRFSAEQHLLAHGTGTCGESHTHQGCHTDCEGCPHSSPDPIEEDDYPASSEEPAGLTITIPDHELLVACGIDLSQTLKSAQVVLCVFAWFWTQPDVIEEIGSPGGCGPGCGGGPLQLCALTAGQRLVRTSQALLI